MRLNKVWGIVLAVVTICTFFVVDGVSQKKYKLMYRPEPFMRPVLYTEGEKNIQYINQNLKKNRDREVWSVMCDSEGAKTYKKPSDSSAEEASLSFRQIYYVIDETLEWVELVEARSYVTDNRLKAGLYKGWIKKENILLWKESGRDEQSGINIKAYILNNGKYAEKIIQSGTKSLAKVYSSPTASVNDAIDEIRLYDFYFLYKVSNTQPKRFLIGKESSYSNSTTKDVIIGWVESSKVTQWRTRICLEPNFDEEAFNERRSEQNRCVKGMSNQLNAMTLSTTGEIAENEILWDNDLACTNDNQLASYNNPRRYKGQVVRFPMLKKSKNYFHSATIGKISTKVSGQLEVAEQENKESDMPNSTMVFFEEYLKTFSRKVQNYQVLFVIEAVKDHQRVQEHLNAYMGAIQSSLPGDTNVKYGVGLYKDAAEGKDALRVLSMTSSKTKVIDFVRNTTFERSKDNDPENALFYAMKKSIEKSSLDKESSTIMVVLASNRDISQNKLRKISKSVNGDEEYFVPENDLKRLLSDYGVHLLASQVQNTNKSSHMGFQEQMRQLSDAVATYDFIQSRNISTYVKGLETDPPRIPDWEASNQIDMSNATLIASIQRPSYKSEMDASNTKTWLADQTKKVSKYTESLYSSLSSVIRKGDAINPESGTWGPGVAKVLWGILEGSGDAKKARLLKLVHEKYRLYFDLYLPTQYPGASHPLYKFGVFMPHDDLVEYHRILKDLAKVEGQPIAKQREVLYETFVELMRQFTGDNKRRSIDKKDIDDFRAVLQGIQHEGYFIGDRVNIKIGELMNDKIVKDEQIRGLVDRIVSRKTELKRIIDLKDEYEYSYTPNRLNTYYWIKESLLF